MTKNKGFDCVEMKSKIQQELLQEEQQLSREEARKRRKHEATNDAILGPFLAKLNRSRSRQEPVAQ